MWQDMSISGAVGACYMMAGVGIAALAIGAAYV